MSDADRPKSWTGAPTWSQDPRPAAEPDVDPDEKSESGPPPRSTSWSINPKPSTEPDADPDEKSAPARATWTSPVTWSLRPKPASEPDADADEYEPPKPKI